MVLTKDFVLPTEEELTVPELNVTASALHTGAFHLGKYCEEPCKVSLVWVATCHFRGLPYTSPLADVCATFFEHLF